MPLPAIIIAAGYAITAYEMYRLSANAYEELEKFQSDMKKAKEEIKKIMKDLQNEISDKIDKKKDKVILNGLVVEDEKTQSQKTKNAQGRLASDAAIKAMIKQGIPFRQIISQICEKADQLPMVQLRKKKGTKLKEVVPKGKADAVAKLLRLTAEEFLNISIDDFIVVRLKQLATNIMFEFIDELLKWKSPLKAEVCFGYDIKTRKYLTPILEGSTRLKRNGPEINPFFPMPYKGKGVIGADLIIPEYRGEPLTLTNIFALVEIKFQGDRLDEKQLKSYSDLKNQCKKEKLLSKVTASEGFKLSLFRFPEDASSKEQKNSKTPTTNRGRKTN